MIDYWPIILNTQEISDILHRRKYQLRFLVEPQPIVMQYPTTGVEFLSWFDGHNKVYSNTEDINAAFPFGSVGDRLIVKEEWGQVWDDETYEVWHYVYRATSTQEPKTEEWANGLMGWQPASRMPEEASRIIIEIDRIRMEPLQSMSQRDARDEGVWQDKTDGPWNNWESNPELSSPLDRFQERWNAKYAKQGYSWETNPYVWRIEFHMIRCLKASQLIGKLNEMINKYGDLYVKQYNNIWDGWDDIEEVLYIKDDPELNERVFGVQ